MSTIHKIVHRLTNSETLQLERSDFGFTTVRLASDQCHLLSQET